MVRTVKWNVEGCSLMWFEDRFCLQVMNYMKVRRMYLCFCSNWEKTCNVHPQMYREQ